MGGVFPALVDLVVTLIRVKEQDVGFACFTIATLVLVRSIFMSGICIKRMSKIWTSEIWNSRSPYLGHKSTQRRHRLHDFVPA